MNIYEFTPEIITIETDTLAFAYLKFGDTKIWIDKNCEWADKKYEAPQKVNGKLQHIENEWIIMKDDDYVTHFLQVPHRDFTGQLVIEPYNSAQPAHDKLIFIIGDYYYVILSVSQETLFNIFDANILRAIVSVSQSHCSILDTALLNPVIVGIVGREKHE